MASSKINIDLVLNTKGFRPLGRINGQLGEFEKSLDASNARVLAFGASAGAILAVRKAFTATVKAAIEVEKSLQDINVILQATSANLKKFGSDLFQIASQTGQSFQVAAQAAAELARQGLGTEETLKRTRDALILARLSGMGAAEAVNSLTAAINTFNKAGLDSTAIINKLANVDAAFAVSSDDLAKALGRVGSSAQAAGVSLDQLLAIVTTVQQKTARGGAVIGNSFKTIFTRVQRPRVIKELENLGVAVRDVEGEMLPAIKVLGNLAKQFDNLSSSQRSQISELVGGVFQVNILKAAMSDLSKETGIYSRALDISLGSSDQAIKRNEELNKTLSAQFNRTVNTFKEGAAELGQLTFGPALENLFGIVEGFEKLGETDGGKIGGAIAKSIFEGIGNFIAGPGLLIIGFTLFKTFSQLGKFAADAFKTLTGLNKNFQNQLNLQKQIFNVLDENPDLLRKIKDGTLSVEDAHEEIFKQINKNTDALETQLLLSQRLAQQLAGSGVGFSPDFGAVSAGKKPKFGGGAAGGYIPNFDDEIASMIASGYSKSQIKNPKVKRQNIHDGKGGSFSATVNGHEDIINTKNSMGKKATFVVPPRNTDAYEKYMSALGGGFVPNFAGISLGPFVKNFKGKKDDLLNRIRTDIASGKMSANVLQAGREDLGLSVDDLNAARKEGKAILDKSKVVSKKGDLVSGQGDLVDLKKRHAAKGQLRVYDAKKEFGLLGLYGTSSDRGYVEAPISKIAKYKGVESRGLPSRIGFKNVQFRSLSGQLDDAKQDAWFTKELRKKFALPMERLTNSFAKRMLKDDAMSVKISGRGEPLFSVSAEGNIFETAINALTAQGKGDRAKSFEAALGADQNQTWDFEESGKPDGLFRKYFDFDASILKADAKRTLSKGAGSSMVNKIFNTSVDQLGRGSAVWMNELKKAKGTKAGGYIPNFNALFESVRREREAGVPAGRIRVGQSDRLKNSANPAGIGIYNTRDEPMGLNQGINNSIAAGIDPKRKGMARGFFPNFFMTNPAARPPSGSSTPTSSSSSATAKNTKAVEKNTMGAMKAMLIMGLVEQAASGLNNAVDENNTVAKSLTGSIATLVTAAVALKYAMDQAKDSFGITARRGTAEGQQQRMRVGRDITARGLRMQRAGSRMSRDSSRPITARSRLGRLGQRAGNLGRGLTGRAMGGAGRVMAGAGGRIGGALASGGLAAGAGVALGGLAIGKVVGDLFSNSDLDPTFKAAREAGKAFERIREQTEKNIGALTSFSTAAQQAADVYGDASATMTQVLNASKKLDKEMQKLPAEFRATLAGIADPDMINNIVQQFTEQEQKKAATAGQAKFAADTVRQSRDFGAAEFFSSPLDSLSNLVFTGNIAGRTEEDVKLNDQNIEQVGKNIIQSSIGAMGSDNFASADFNKVFQDVAAIDPDDEKARKETLAKGLGLDPEKNAAEMKILMDIFNEGGEQAEKFFKSLSENTLQLQADLKVQKAMEPARKAFIKANREAEKQIRNQKKALESEQRLRKAVIEITSKAAKSFLTEVGSIKLDQINKLNDVQAESTKKFAGVISEVQTAASKTDGAMGGDLDNRVQALLSRASDKGLGKGSVTQGQADAVASEIQAKIEELRASEDPVQKAQADKLEATKIAIENLGGTSERMKEELKQQTHEIKEQTKEQVRAARQAQRLRSFGGTAALLDPSKLNTQLGQIRAGGQAMALSAAAGSQTGVNRGRINQLAAIQDLMGGSLPEHVKQEGIKRAEQVKFSDISKMNRSLGLGMSQEDMRKAAREQAANLFKSDDPQKQNTNALESLNKTLKEGIEFVDREGKGRIEINDMENQYARSRGRRGQENMRRAKMLREGYSGKAKLSAEQIAAMEDMAQRGTTWADIRNNTAYAAGTGWTVGSVAGGIVGAGAGGVGALPGAGIGGAVGAAGAGSAAFLGGVTSKLLGPGEDDIRGAGTKLMEANAAKRAQFEQLIKAGGDTTNNNSYNIKVDAKGQVTSDGKVPFGRAMVEGGQALMQEGYASMTPEELAEMGRDVTAMKNTIKQIAPQEYNQNNVPAGK